MAASIYSWIENVVHRYASRAKLAVSFEHRAMILICMMAACILVERILVRRSSVYFVV